MADGVLEGLIGPELLERFRAVGEALRAERVDPRDRDAFLMARPVIELVRAARPEAGLGDAIDETVAFLHLGFLFWSEGAREIEVAPERLERLLGAGPAPAASPSSSFAAYYVRVPPRRIWASPLEGAAAEPLEGWFASRHGATLRVVALFGVRADRDGFTAVAAEGGPPGVARRADGAPPFSPTLPGGTAAGIHSLADQAELLELAWRLERDRDPEA